MTEAALDPFALFAQAHKSIAAGDYDEALEQLSSITLIRPIVPLLLVQSTRMAAEIMLAGKKHSEDAVRVFAFSRVPPAEWPESMGVAGLMLGKAKSSIGNVVMDFGTKRPVLVASDDWCHACHTTDGGTHKCSQCRQVHYCCADHQKADWPSHKVQCIAFTKRDTAYWYSCNKYVEELNVFNKMFGKVFKE